MTTSLQQEKAYFGGGCFWCTEAIYQNVKGVSKVTSGYAGGTHPNPSYFKVSEELTGHAEVIEVIFDTAQVSYTQLLDIFFHTHNPTTLNQQGADHGSQYRSIILATSHNQLEQAQAYKKKLQEDREFSDPIVTEITSLEKFFPAEEYHKDYYQRNQGTPYCDIVISPKLAKFRERYAQLAKTDV